MKKGFTLVEVIGVVILLGVIVIIAYSPLLNFIKKTNSEIDDASKEIIFAATSRYVSEYQNDFPTTNGNIYCVAVHDLISKNYMTSLNLNDYSINSTVKVTISDNNYNYSIDNSCTSSN